MKAIERYVLSKFKSSGADLLHEDNLAESAMVNVWLKVVAQWYDKVMSPIFYQRHPRLLLSQDERESGGGEPGEALQGARLSKSKYLADDFLSFADINQPHPLDPLLHVLASRLRLRRPPARQGLVGELGVVAVVQEGHRRHVVQEVGPCSITLPYSLSKS
ncbi:putative glutathione S-transferase GSTF1 [Canna indica]|uniref:glutathione transferase n=1 Tax=Canna indica TaxID=4628 RepID=A0AAQ3KRA4_9LILI|nr:putative glutathione S-transferase GSTF1 [Canna indica]